MPEFLLFNCSSPDCGRKIKIAKPSKAGVFAVECPHCGQERKIRWDGPSRPADNSKAPAIELNEEFIVDCAYKVRCPHCGKEEFGFKTDKPGHRVVPCPACKGGIGFEVRGKTAQVADSLSLQRHRGKLTVQRFGIKKKEFRLSDGVNTIGRYDENEPSDISIHNDSTMSRRSVQIEVMMTEKGYRFKMTVLKTTNPVLLNGKPLGKEESVSLNFGDIITMGKTKFRFDKEN